MKPVTKIAVAAGSLLAVLVVANAMAPNKTDPKRKELIKRFGHLDNGNVGKKLARMTNPEVEDLHWFLISREQQKVIPEIPAAFWGRLAAIEAKYAMMDLVMRQWAKDEGYDWDDLVNSPTLKGTGIAF